MGEKNDSLFEKDLLKNIDKEIQIDVNFIDTSAKNSSCSTKAKVSPPKQKKSNSSKA